jgi:dTMP kinase
VDHRIGAAAHAADRYAHLESEIAPALKAGKVVITDRYVQSSLVLQRLDGLALARASDAEQGPHSQRQALI